MRRRLRIPDEEEQQVQQQPSLLGAAVGGGVTEEPYQRRIHTSYRPTAILAGQTQAPQFEEGPGPSSPPPTPLSSLSNPLGANIVFDHPPRNGRFQAYEFPRPAKIIWDKVHRLETHGEDKSMFLPDDSEKHNIWAPWSSGQEFALARYFHTSAASRLDIDNFFNWDLAASPAAGPSCCADVQKNGAGLFSSGETYLRRMDDAARSFGLLNWHDKSFPPNKFPGFAEKIEYKARGLVDTLRGLFAQPHLAQHTTYVPQKWYDSHHRRIIGPAYTGNYWYRRHAELQRRKPGHFLILVVCHSDDVELTRYNGDKEMNPVNVSCLNFDPIARQSPSMGAVRAVALFPSRLKYTGSESGDEKLAQRLRASEIQQEIIKEIFKDIEKLEEDGIEIVCPDGVKRYGHPVLAGWIADYMELVKLFSISNNTCPICLTKKKKLETHPLRTDKRPLRHDYQETLDFHVKRFRHYQGKVDNYIREGKDTKDHDYKKAQDKMKKHEKECRNLAAIPVKNALWSIAGVTPHELWKPDLLHTLDLGMVHKIIQWAIQIMVGLPPLAQVFDVLWVLATHHPHFDRKPNKSWRRFKQKQGSESRTAAHMLLAVLEAAVESFRPEMNTPASNSNKQARERAVLQEEDAQIISSELQEALNGVAALMDFHRFSYYDYHSYGDGPNEEDNDKFVARDSHFMEAATLQQMHLAVVDFYDTMDVYRKYHALCNNKSAGKAESKKAVDSIRARYKATLKTKALAKKQPALRRREKDARDEINSKTKLGCPKLHMMSHFCRHIMEDGTLTPLSSATSELCLKVYKEGFNRSNKDMYVGQVFKFVAHRDVMILKMAQLRHLLENGDLSPEVRRDIEKYTGLYTSPSERKTARADIKRHLTPKAKLEQAEKRRIQRENLMERRKARTEALTSDEFYKLLGRPSGADESNTPRNDVEKERDDEDDQTQRQPSALEGSYVCRGVDFQNPFYTIKPQHNTPAGCQTGEEDLDLVSTNKGTLAPRPLGHIFILAQQSGDFPINDVATAADNLDKYRGIPTDEFTAALEDAMSAENLLHTFAVDDLKSLEVVAYTQLNMPRSIPRYPREDDKENYIIHCTPPGHKVYAKDRLRRNDFIAYRLKNSPSPLANEHVGRCELFFNVKLYRQEAGGRRCNDAFERSFVAVRPTEYWEPTPQQLARRIHKVRWTDRTVAIIPMECVTRAVSVVPIIGPYKWNDDYIPPNTDDEKEAYIRMARGFVVNNRIDAETFNIYT